jgi:hypothetical protein
VKSSSGLHIRGPGPFPPLDARYVPSATAYESLEVSIIIAIVENSSHACLAVSVDMG